MSKKLSIPDDGSGIKNIPYCSRLATEGTFRMLEGRILTIVETIGLPQKQEDAIKSIIRSDIWEIWNSDMPMVLPKEAEGILNKMTSSLERDKLVPEDYQAVEPYSDEELTAIGKDLENK